MATLDMTIKQQLPTAKPNSQTPRRQGTAAAAAARIMATVIKLLELSLIRGWQLQSSAARQPFSSSFFFQVISCQSQEDLAALANLILVYPDNEPGPIILQLDADWLARCEFSHLDNLRFDWPEKVSVVGSLLTCHDFLSFIKLEKR